MLKKSKKSRARLGILKTPHGEVETPALVTVGTQAAVKTLTSAEAYEAKSRLLICNTFHLHLKPGEKIVKAGGGLHEFMAWENPIMTDSGGFQVFSLGFGKDFGIGKILKSRSDEVITQGQQPKLIKITEAGVEFTSYLDGRKLFLGPRDSMRIQEALGADIIFAFDEPTSPIASREYAEESLGRTHRWAEICLQSHKTKQALYGIVQGGRWKDLRQLSAKKMASMDFPGFGIGGEFGGDKKLMSKMLEWTIAELPEGKPRHLLGIGYPEDFPVVMRGGVDTFDCIVPTHFARHGVVFTAKGRLDMKKQALLTDKKPLDPACKCRVCGTYTRSYIAHLFRAKEISALSLSTFHNLFYFNTLAENYRKAIKQGKI